MLMFKVVQNNPELHPTLENQYEFYFDEIELINFAFDKYDYDIEPDCEREELGITDNAKLYLFGLDFTVTEYYDEY